MNRLRQLQAEVFGEALKRFPVRWQPLTGCDLFCGDPLFAGINAAAWTTDDAGDGRSYRTIAHACYPHHVRDRRLTVVLPKPDGLYTAIHELGHVVHWTLQERVGGWHRLPRLEPVTAYAQRNQEEEFAEALTAWFYPPAQVDADPYWLGWSRPNAEFFDRLLVA